MVLDSCLICNEKSENEKFHMYFLTFDPVYIFRSKLSGSFTVNNGKSAFHLTREKALILEIKNSLKTENKFWNKKRFQVGHRSA